MTTPDTHDRPASGAEQRLGRFLLGGTAWGAVGLAAAVGLALVVNAVAARLLTEADFGAFLLLVSVAQVVAVVAEAGQQGLIVREMAGRHGDDPVAAAGYALRAVVLVTGLSLLVAVLALVGGRPFAALVFDDPAIERVFWLLGVLVLARVGERVVGDVFRGLHDIPRAILFGTVWTQLAGAVGLGALLLWLGEVTGVAAVATYGLAGASVLPLGLLVLRSRLAGTGLPRDGYRELLVEGWPLVGHRLLSMLVQQAPLWIVAAIVGASAAAPFGLALRVVAMVAVPLTVVNQVVPPVVARLLHRDDATLERAIRSTATLAATGAVVVVGVFTLFGGPIIRVAFGAQYVEEAAPILAVLALGQLGAVWAGSCGIVLLQLGEQRTLRTITGSVVVVELAAATVAALTLGPLAVAVVAAAAVAVQNAATVVAVRRVSGLRTDASLPVALREARLRHRRWRDQREDPTP